MVLCMLRDLTGIIITFSDLSDFLYTIRRGCRLLLYKGFVVEWFYSSLQLSFTSLKPLLNSCSLSLGFFCGFQYDARSMDHQIRWEDGRGG